MGSIVIYGGKYGDLWEIYGKYGDLWKFSGKYGKTHYFHGHFQQVCNKLPEAKLEYHSYNNCMVYDMQITIVYTIQKSSPSGLDSGLGGAGLREDQWP